MHKSKDDGVEFFGGSVNVKHLLLTGIGDDSLDWTYGWNGKVQHVVIQQYADDADNGIEADNHSKEHDAMPRSYPTLSNLTIIGSPDSSKSDIGILLRAGTNASISNAIVTQFNSGCLDIDDAATFTQAGGTDGTPTGKVSIANSIVHCPTSKDVKEKDMADDKGPADPWSLKTFYELADNNNQMATDAMINAPLSETAPDFGLMSASPAATGAMVPYDSFFDQVNYIGGVDPSDDWTKGWTEFPAK